MKLRARIAGLFRNAGRLLGMSRYVAMGLAMLAFFALLGLLGFSLIFYLVLFFVITCLMVGSLLYPVGAGPPDAGEGQASSCFRFRVGPKISGSVVGRIPNSEVLVFPTKIRPARR